MKAYGEVDVYTHVFFTAELVGGEWSASCPWLLCPMERVPSTRWIGGWVYPRTGLDDLEKRKFFIPPRLKL
jgi:hypothetical protein